MRPLLSQRRSGGITNLADLLACGPDVLADHTHGLLALLQKAGLVGDERPTFLASEATHHFADRVGRPLAVLAPNATKDPGEVATREARRPTRWVISLRARKDTRRTRKDREKDDVRAVPPGSISVMRSRDGDYSLPSAPSSFSKNSASSIS
jgi:hypothetical protein